MGTVPGTDETVGISQRLGKAVRLVEDRVATATGRNTRSLADVVGAVALLLLGIWVGRR